MAEYLVRYIEEKPRCIDETGSGEYRRVRNTQVIEANTATEAIEKVSVQVRGFELDDIRLV